MPTYLRNKNPHLVRVSVGNEIWTLDTLDEFFAQYPQADRYELGDYIDGATFRMEGDNDALSVSVKLNSRSLIESVFNVLEKNLSDNILRSEKEPIRVFIGHGHSTQWRDLKDHLHEEHGLSVVTYPDSRSELVSSDVRYRFVIDTKSLDLG